MESEEANRMQISIDVEKENAEVPLLAMVTSLKEDMAELSELTPNHCIYRVPKQLRVKNPAAYTPKVVSVGPIHYKGEGLEAMEEYKQRYLKLYLERVDCSLEEFAKFVKVREPRLRECYVDTIHLTSCEFVKLMMVDSAFVYGMLVEARCGTGGSCRIFNRPFLVIDVMEDLMLLENQIPLFILEDLYNLDKEYRQAQRLTSQNIEPATARADSFMGLVYKLVNNRNDIGVRSFDINKVSSSRVVHLLDCLWACHLSPLQLTNPPPDKSGFLVSKPGSRSIFCNLLEKLGDLNLGCLWRSHQPRYQSVPRSEEGESSNVRVSTPTITELHQSGVKFSKNTESTHLLDIKFDYHQGTLKIPQFFMGDSTETIFRNLLAFEQCHYENDQRLTDYFVLLDQLISQPSDVDLLVQSGVLENGLGDSSQATSIINNIALGLAIDSKSHFDVLCRALAKYYKVPWHKWKATLRQDYFNNPWAGISVIAAAILLVLAVIQTVYAVISK